MAFANASYSDIIATTIQSRSKKIADNVTENNVLLNRLSKKGKIKTASGGNVIIQEISQAENSNGTWMSGYDTLPTGAVDMITAAEFDWKQYAVPCVISGREMMMNSGDEAKIDLMESRLEVTEATAKNAVEAGLFSDGTGSGGKIITGLDAAVPQVPTTGTYGGINRATASNAFWRSQLHDTTVNSAATCQTAMNTLWAQCVRGTDEVDLIILGGTIWQYFLANTQSLQRMVDVSTATVGFTSLKFMKADVVLGGGIGGSATATDAYFLNTNYIHWRPHAQRNFVSLSPSRRYATNQDAEVAILALMANLTMSGSQFQGRGKWD